MKRNPRKVKWTKSFRKAVGKELAVDSTFEFEKRRNIPVRYDRDLVKETLAAISTVQTIKSKREIRFFKNRMSSKKQIEKEEAEKEVKQNIELLSEAPVSLKALSKAQKETVKASSKMEIDQ